ncbi:MAG: tetratricopeptide repeat protein [Acidobacteriota bacterium]|nr:MAG: tetratricopeptide repeat protein [Acidobacteriota bacterium]
MFRKWVATQAGPVSAAFFLLLAGFASLSAQTDAGAIVARATQLHQAGNYDAAVTEYLRFLEIHPNVADIRSNLGAAYVGLGRLDKAIEQYLRALELGNATNPNALRFNLALAYYKTVQLRDASRELEKVLAEDPANKQAALILADSYLRQDEYENVIRVLEAFEGTSPDDKALAYLLGTALIRTGDVTRGQVLVDRILRDGESAEAHMMMGTAFMMAREIPKALEEFERALSLNPRLPSLNAFMGKTLREMGRVDESTEFFQRELEINPLDFDSLLYVGVYEYKRQQNYEAALALFNRALQIRPGALEVRFQIGLVYVLTDRIDEALEIVEKVVEESPDFLEGHVTLTRLYYRLKRREDAQKHREIVEELRAKKDEATVKEVDPLEEGR